MAESDLNVTGIVSLEAGSVFVLRKGLRIQGTGALIISEGAEVRLGPGQVLSCAGRYEINGTDILPVLIRSIDPENRSGGLVLTGGQSGGVMQVNYTDVKDATIGIHITSPLQPLITKGLRASQCGTGIMITGTHRQIIDDIDSTLEGGLVEDCDIGIHLQNTNSVLKGVSLRQWLSTKGNGVGIYVNSSPRSPTEYLPQIQNCSISNFSTGIRVSHRNDVLIEGNQIFDNALDGILLERSGEYYYGVIGNRYANRYYDYSPLPTISNNQIYGSGRYAVNCSDYRRRDGDVGLEGSNWTIDASNNWWGTSEADEISALIYEDTDDASRPTVNFLPASSAPSETVLVTILPSELSHVAEVGQLRIRIVYPKSMRTDIPVDVQYLPNSASEYTKFSAPIWSTTIELNDTLSVTNAKIIDYSSPNGRAIVTVSGAESIDGSNSFPFSDNWFYIDFPADSQGPRIDSISRPTTVRESETFTVSIHIYDSFSDYGNHGVLKAVLSGGYEAPFDSIKIAGTGPTDGNGDGLWTFEIPAQVGFGDEDFKFTITGWDTTGRERVSGQQTVRVIGSTTDTDRDGLLDWFEWEHFGNLNQTLRGDTDGDGVSNELEQWLNTDANDNTASNLIGWWNFDAGNANDASGRGSNGTVTGGSFGTTRVAGAKALEFVETGDRLDLGFSPALKASSFTITGFVNLTFLPPSGECLIWDNLKTNSGLRLSVDAEGRLAYTSRGVGGEARVVAEQSMKSGSWYGFGVSSDGSTTTLFLDGVIVGSIDVTDKYTPSAFTERTFVGNTASGGSSSQLLGIIDELRYWNVPLSAGQVMMGSKAGADSFENFSNWRTGFEDSNYTSDDSTVFAFNDNEGRLDLALPNVVQDSTGYYAYRFIERAGNNFTFRYDLTIETPGFDAPLRVGMKENGSLNWGSDKGFSAAFAFRSSGFKLELYSRDGSNTVRRQDWADGFRLDDPSRWVTVEFAYDEIAKTLEFNLFDRLSGEVMANHTFTGVTPFGVGMDEIVISNRGDDYGNSGFADTTKGSIDNIVLLPFARTIEQPTNVMSWSAMSKIGETTDSIQTTFRIEGGEADRVVIRALGPALGALGLSSSLDDPQIEIRNSKGELVAANMSWGTFGDVSGLVDASSAAGLVPLAENSQDAAWMGPLASDTYSVRLTSESAIAGDARIEIAVLDDSARLVYAGVRGEAGVGQNVLTSSLVVAGNASQRFVIRALAPELGRSAAISDPILTIYRGETVVATNDNWTAGSDLTEAVQVAGLQSLLPNSKDAALALDLGPGSYVIQVKSKGGETGETLLEVAKIDSGRDSVFAPSVVSGPANADLLSGANVRFGAVAMGKPFPAFAWTKDDTAVPSANASRLDVMSVGTNDEGSYQVIVTNAGGTASSEAATLTILGAQSVPQITTNPSSQSATAGADLLLEVVATGEGGLTYQWYRNGSPITGAIGTTLMISGIQPGAAGNYSVVVTNDAGSATSTPAVITVETVATAPEIVVQPNDQAVALGSDVVLAVVTTGSAPLTFQWIKDGVALPQANAAILEISAITTSELGRYKVTVTNVGGTVTSDEVEVSLALSNESPSIIVQPKGASVNAGSSVTLSVVAGGVPAPSYQWFKGGDPLTGKTGPVLRIASFASSDAGEFSVRVANSEGSIDSEVASLTLNLAPQIVEQPVGGVVFKDEDFALSVTATGSGELSYQWRKDGEPLSGKTSRSLGLIGASETDSGVYDVLVTNAAGLVVSEPTIVAIWGSSIAGVQDATTTGYVPGEVITITNTFNFPTEVSSLGWSVLLPTGSDWSYTGGSENQGEVRPEVGTQELLEWAWSSVPSSPLTFTYDLLVPSTSSGPVELVTMALARFGGTELTVVANPDPLVIQVAQAKHSADINGDFSLSLPELLRVIELYNTRQGTTRTGRYRISEGSEDGFGADSLTPSSDPSVLTRHHSADFNQDSKLSLTELLRVIELYNTRLGTRRTGSYHVDPSTEDGFAPGESPQG